MKKLLVLLSVFFILVSLCACSVESVEEHDKKEASSSVQASEDGEQASRDSFDSQVDSSKGKDASSEDTTQSPNSENAASTTSVASKNASSKENAVKPAVTAATTYANNNQGGAYSYYVTEYEVSYEQKTSIGTKKSIAHNGATTARKIGNASSSASSKSASRVNTGTSKIAEKAKITVSQSAIDISSVLSNPHFSQNVKERLENSNPYVKDYQVLVPSYGKITVKEGSTVLDVLKLVLATERKGSSDFAANPNAVAGVKNSAYGKYVYSICGLAEKDCGSKSGWTYKVNGKTPSISADKYVLKSGDKIEWVYVTG